MVTHDDHLDFLCVICPGLASKTYHEVKRVEETNKAKEGMYMYNVTDRWIVDF